MADDGNEVPQDGAMLALDPRLHHVIGKSPAIRRALDKLPLLSSCDAGVLVIGETGTGKEVFAQAVHYLSPRRQKPWVAVNCGAIPTELVESELFGHVRGAYTSASQSRQGLVSEAEGGTLFLDDIDCLPPLSQTRLLRFLQEKEFRAVGSNVVRHADVRIIAASNRRLDQMVARGEFRQDLYYRLNVLTLCLPPLRKRKEDIAEMARLFVRQYAEQFRRPSLLGIAPQAIELLMSHPWPGNVRELRHVIERAVLLSKGPILLPADICLSDFEESSTPEQSFRAAKEQAVREFERAFLSRLLRAHGGNVTHAAQAAGKHRRAFFELMRKHRIESSLYGRNAGQFRDDGSRPAMDIEGSEVD